jgi:protein-disulfide isomerase
MTTTDRLVGALIVTVLLSAIGQVVIVYQLHHLQQSVAGHGQFGRPPVQSLPDDPVSLDGARLTGLTSAPVAVIEFSDFECPYCREFAKTVLPVLQQEYIGRGTVLFAFRHLPLRRHMQAVRAAQAAECAGSQGMFWEMHDALFRTTGWLAAGEFDDLVGAVGLRLPDFQKFLAAPQPAGILEDLEAAKLLRISSTPTFLIGRLQKDRRVTVTASLRGARPIAEFRDAIEAVLVGHRPPSI